MTELRKVATTASTAAAADKTQHRRVVFFTSLTIVLSGRFRILATGGGQLSERKGRKKPALSISIAVSSILGGHAGAANPPLKNTAARVSFRHFKVLAFCHELNGIRSKILRELLHVWRFVLKL